MHLKIFYVIALFVFGIQSLSAQICSDPLNVIYGLGQNGKIQPIHVSNGVVDSSITNSGSAGYPGSTGSANAIGLDIETNTFYFFQNNGTTTQQFVSFNAVTNQYTMLAASPISGGVVKGCVTADGTGYYCIDGDGDLCYYNIAANAWTLISSDLTDQNNNSLADTLSSLGSGDIAIDGLGNLWIIVSSPSQWGLYELKGPLPVAATPTVQLTEMIPPTQPTPTGTQFAGIAYNATGQIYLSTGNDLYLLQNDFSITHLATFSVPGIGDDLTSCNYPFDVLAIHWLAFSASPQFENKVLIIWSVSLQDQNKGYYIEHSTDGRSWEIIGYQSNNHLTGAENYSFKHMNVKAGIHYYRIEATTMSGKMSYSEIRIVNMAGKSNGFSIWPVPVRNTLHVQLNTITNEPNNRIVIFNSSGQIVFSGFLHGGVNTIDLSLFHSGTYTVTAILDNGNILSQRVEKL